MPEVFLWAYDSTNGVWVKIKTDSEGRLYTVAVIDHLSDIGDVNAASPSDNQALTWDAATSKWIPEAPVPAAHKTSHQDGGTDEISINGLAGESAELATHKANGSAHQSNVITITFIIDGGGAAITTGQKGHLEIPFACTVTAWTLLADVAGAIVVDIWKDTYANFPPTDADAMPGAGKEPTIAATNQKGQDTDLSDWSTVAIAAGNILAFNVDSCTTITRVTLSLKCTKS